MVSFHKTSVDNILATFSTLQKAQDEATTVYVRNYLNHLTNDVKLSIGKSTSGNLINGVSGQPTYHCS